MMQDIDWPKPDGKLRIFQLEQELTAARAAIRDLAGALERVRDYDNEFWVETALTAHADEIAKAQTRG